MADRLRVETVRLPLRIRVLAWRLSAREDLELLWSTRHWSPTRWWREAERMFTFRREAAQSIERDIVVGDGDL